MESVLGADEPPKPLPSLSPSRANDFMTCPLLFRFRTIDRLPEPTSPDAVRGTLVHKVLERLFDLPADERTTGRAELMVGPEWEELTAEEPGYAALFEGEDALDFGAWLDVVRRALNTYFTLEDPQRLSPSDREVHVETVLDERLRVHGYIDRLEVSPDGLIRVSDYKTGRAPRAGFEGKAFFQLKIYALILWRTRGVVPKQLQLLYLGSGDVLRLEPTEAELLATESKLHSLWDAISAAQESHDFRPTKSRLCDWCAHQALCPAFGGTPPPYPV